MSRAYRIAVSGSVEKIVHVDDGVCGAIELLPILPKERMQDLLGKELEKRGFKVEGHIAKKSPEKNVTVEVDMEKSTVTVRASGDVELDIKRQKSAVLGDRRPAEDRLAQATEKLKDQLDAELARAADQEIERARRDVTSKLEGKLRDLKVEIDDAINRVTGEALKEKARTMGEIEEMSEDPATGALTIKVKL